MRPFCSHQLALNSIKKCANGYKKCYPLLGYFSLHEKSLPIAELVSIERYQYGRVNGLIGWKLSFKNGTVLDISPPNIEALQRLLALPNVTFNITLRDGKLYQNKP